MASTSPSCNCDCQSDYAHVLSTVDSIEEKVDSINGDLEDYVQTHELEEAQTEMNGRQDQLQSDFTALDDRAAASKESVDQFKGRLDQLEATDHFFEGKLDNREADHMVAVQQIATESQAVVQAVVDRVYIHCNRLHNRQATQRVELASQQQQCGNLATQTDNNLVQIQRITGTVRKVRRALKNCVQMETLESALDAVFGRLKSLEYAFNLLPAGLASDQFVNHVVAISRQPAATPKRQPLKRKQQNMFLTPVRRSPRIAGTPLYEADANLLR